MVGKFLVTKGAVSVTAGSSLCTVFAGVGEGDSFCVTEKGQAPVLEMSEMSVTSDFLGLCRFSWATDDEEGLPLAPAFEDTGEREPSASVLLADRGKPMPIIKKHILYKYRIIYFKLLSASRYTP